jgi:succinate dehydrogenase / fumarate reductase flavoprotein subunit
VILATGGAGKIYKYTSNSWEGTGDGHALALWAGADLIDMEFFQLHPTGMIWPPSARGILVTEGVRGDGGVLRNSDGERFMFNHIPEFFKAETADSIDEGDRWYDDHVNNRRPPELLPRDEVARAINAEVKHGRGSPHGGAFLDIASRRSAEDIKRRLPSMYHQFKHLADVDITKEPMEVGPTAHYIMGGVRVDADSQATSVSGLYAAGEVSGGMHGANRLGGNSLSDLIVFGRRAGEYAAKYALGMPSQPVIDSGQVDGLVRETLAPFDRGTGENPYSLHHELEDVMQDLVGIIRVESEMQQAIDKIEALKERAKNTSIQGHVQYNPGWGEATDLPALLTVAECVTRAAYERKESRGGHTRDDYPTTDPQWARVNNRITLQDDRVVVDQIPLPEMPDDLKKLFEEGH